MRKTKIDVSSAEVCLLLADGFEEVEALCTLDILRRGGVKVVTVGITGMSLTGSHGVCVQADCAPSDITSTPKMVILPGGMPGTSYLDASLEVSNLLKSTYAAGGYLAAICAAPSVLGHRGYLRGVHAVCFPGFEKELTGVIPGDGRVVCDGQIVTAVAMGASEEFGLTLLSLLRGENAAKKVKESAFIR